MEKNNYFDKLVSKVISRKFLVWIFATIFMLLGTFTKYSVLRSADWVTISAIYIGGQAVLDIALAFKGNSPSGVSSFVQNNILQQAYKTKINKKKDENEDTKRPTKFGGTISG